jgi:hypothetical protein
MYDTEKQNHRKILNTIAIHTGNFGPELLQRHEVSQNALITEDIPKEGKEEKGNTWSQHSALRCVLRGQRR